MGFAEEDVDALSDDLVDALVAWGDVDAIVGRVRAQAEAGADHVAVNLVSTDPATSLDQWRSIAGALLSR